MPAYLSLPGGVFGFPFNSLFEMLHRPSSFRDVRDVTFNSLFEMPGRRLAHQRLISRIPFNSLFEMLTLIYGTESLALVALFQFSI
mgnify:CR=1 FL=1